MTKVYANGNDTVLIYCEGKNIAEIECYGSDVQIHFSDGTQITYHCTSTEQGDNDWSISVDQEGTAEHVISVDAYGFGDVFEIAAEAVIWVYVEQ